MMKRTIAILGGVLLLGIPLFSQPYPLPRSSEDGIVYGESVSRNEFGIDGGVFLSPDGSRQAVYRKDERAVTEFPLLDISTRTGSLKSIRYPMNGMASEHIDLCVCDTLGNILTTLKVTDFTDERYLTCVSWAPDCQSIFVQVLDREQHHMHLNEYSAADGSFLRTVLTEENSAWVEPQGPLHFIDNEHFIYRTDNRDGYKSLYLSGRGGILHRITTVDADVQFAGFADGWLYYTSAEVSPIENHLFRTKLLNLKKARWSRPERLTPEKGWHEIEMADDCKSFTDRHSSKEVELRVTTRSCDGTLLETSPAGKPASDYSMCDVITGCTPSADGQYENYYRLVCPKDFDPSKKYPLIVYVYGGPHSQMVRDSWMAQIRSWEPRMAQLGYFVYVQDNRGTSNRGAAYEKAINRACGQAEMADQMAGLNALLERCPWLDRDRIGIHGWSYGGFMTISLFTNYPDVFKVALAGGPVIDWKWYEVMYGERYMDTPETNPEGFELTSLMNRTQDVHGKLLICQGAIDNIVVWQHSLSFVQKCIMEGIQLDYFPYPCDEHNMKGKARDHLYDKITGWFTEYL
ncbi:MAG: prolyl oligopeptidase family serine peptidase [Bacteroidales bacterium]|nr:prolyl oligopeptidase family serine peptidase [Bacteroidales bacterium]